MERFGSMSSSRTFIEAVGLTKIYENRVVALNNLNFASRARILGLIGPNGAGKTTFVRIATTLLRPTDGTVRVLGIDVVEKPREVKKRISLVPQDAYPDDRATVYDHVLYYLVARGYSLSDARKRAREILELFEMWHLRNTPCIRLSGGQRKLVIVATALAPYEIEAAFLDEPTTGLDPANRARLWGLLTRFTREGVRVLVTSHELEEVEERVEEVVMIDRGRLVLHEEPQSILSRFSSVACIEVLTGEEIRRVIEYLERRGVLEKVIELGTITNIYVDRRRQGEVVEALASHGLEFRIRRCSLRDAFLWWTRWES